jgi:hypothetical protein
VIPERKGYMLDVRFRMLQPHELADVCLEAKPGSGITHKAAVAMGQVV